MKLPENLIPILEKLLRQLYDLLPLEARPSTVADGQYDLITEAQISQDEEIHHVQRFYNITWLILKKILPGIEQINSRRELKEYLFSKTPLIEEQWSRIQLDRIKKNTPKQSTDIPESSGSIPKNQLETNPIDTLFMDLAYKLFYICKIEIPQQKSCKSSQELDFLYLNESQRIVEPLKLPIFNYIANFLPEEHKPTAEEIIPDKKLSQQFEIQFFQRLYNIVYILANEILPKLQGQCHLPTDLISKLANPVLGKVIKKQAVPLLETIAQAFIEPLYELIPTENRPKKAGEVIKKEQLSQYPFKANPDLQIIAAMYNVSCQIKNSVLPRIKKMASIEVGLLAPAKALSIAWDFLDEIQPLLENLQPVFDQMQIFFVNNLYDQLPENDRPGRRGELIPDDKLSKTSAETFFIQKSYNLACFILNKIIPGIKKCFFSTSIIDFLTKQETHFENHFGFVKELATANDSITLPIAKSDNTASIEIASNDVEASTPLKITKDESLEISKKIGTPFLNLIEKFFSSLSAPIIGLISSFGLFLKEITKFIDPSFTLGNSITAPLVTGNLSYDAACYIYEAREALNKALAAGYNEKDAENDPNLLAEKELNDYLLTFYQSTTAYFGNHKNTSALDSEATQQVEWVQSFLNQQSSSLAEEGARKICVKLNEFIDQ